MSVYQADLKRDIRDNEARKKVADNELNKLNLKSMFEEGELTKALYEAAKWAGNNSSTYRELVVALMHALPEEWKEKVEDTLEGQQFMVSTEDHTSGCASDCDTSDHISGFHIFEEFFHTVDPGSFVRAMFCCFSHGLSKLFEQLFLFGV